MIDLLLHKDRGVLNIPLHSSLDGSKLLGFFLGLALLLLDSTVSGCLFYCYWTESMEDGRGKCREESVQV